ncbi:MAG: PAS domain-containing protein, partial [Rickettsiales bacterium]|nr:PAS domain-containing protein [Rickettsiales bacterium]
MDSTRPLEIDLKTFIESSYDGYWDWYIQDDYEYMSPRFWEMLGYEPEEKRHHPSEWQSIIFEDSLQIALDNFDKHVKTKGTHPFQQEVKYRHKDGSIVYIICKGKVVEWDEEGNPIRMIGTHTDITAQKEAENTLQVQKEYLELSDKVAGIGHWLINIKNKSLFWSDQIYHIHGLKKEEYTPEIESAIESYHPDDKEKVITLVNKAIENQEPFEFKLRLIRPNGELRHVSCRGKIISSIEEPLVFGIFQDITEQVQNINRLEQTLTKLRETEKFQNLISNSNPDLIFVKDQEF